MSEFKRPQGGGLSDDPEACYRAGFQHGAAALYHHIKRHLSEKEQASLVAWTDVALQKWRHDRDAKPMPPEYVRRL